MRATARRAGPQDAAQMLAVITAAFAQRPKLTPPADAMTQTLPDLCRQLTGDLGVLIEDDSGVLACLVLDPRPDGSVFLRRFAVRPDRQGQGHAVSLLAAAEQFVTELMPEALRLRVLARVEVPSGIKHWLHQGFIVTSEPEPYVELSRPLAERQRADSTEKMQQLGRDLASSLRAGDVVLLIGELGAGKTTFTQGLGAGLGVRGAVTSPTFVISRIHPSLTDGPSLVHVDAYRLGDQAELSAIDLEASLDDSISVVEWGRGIAEELSDSWVEVEIVRAVGEVDESREVLIRRIGPRWDA